MAFHRNNNGQNNRYNNNRSNNFRPRHNNNQHNNQQGGQRRHVNRINHVFESTGPDGRVRGTAQQLVEKYTSLARDAQASGDPVLMLNYYQHAEHYQRVYAEILEENGAFEREREAQRAQYNQQPNVDNFGGDAGGFAPGAEQPTAPAQAPAEGGSFIPTPRAPAPTEQPTAETAEGPSSGSMSTGGRVMGRRPNGQGRDGRQMQDDHMPSFLKQDIPIKTSRPAEPKPTGDATTAPAPRAPKAASQEQDAVSADIQTNTDAPAAAAFGKRRTPGRPRQAVPRETDKDAPAAE